MKIKIEKDSYKSSHIFNYIISDFLLVKNSFANNIIFELKTIEAKHKQLEEQRMNLIGDYIDTDLHDIYIDQLSNSHIMNFLFNGALMYYYSQIEIKLCNICERLPLLIECEGINTFNSKSKKKLNRISEYLIKYANIDIKDNKDWLKISDFSEIRNYITHLENIEKKKIPKFKSIAQRNKGKIDYNEISNSVSVKISYLSEMTKVSFDFVEKIIIDIWEKHGSS